MSKVITIFLNPAIDNTLWVTEPVNKEPVSVLREESYAGGKGINLSKTLDSVGLQNLAFGVVGKQNESKFLPLLKNSVKNFKYLYHDGKTRENITLIFPDGNILKVNHTGNLGNNVLSDFKKELLLVSETAEFIAFCGRIPEGIGKEEYTDLILSLKDKKILIDTSSFAFSDYERIKPFAIKPNQKELSDIIGKELKTEEDVINAAKSLLPYCQNILVSMGEKGAVLVNSNGTFKAVPPKVKVLSDIGAGDAAAAGFIYSKTQNLSDIETVKTAVAFGSAAVQTEGTDIVKKEKIDETLKKVEAFKI
jgi:1-phosphofructokinase family hexose kinase